MRAGSAERRGGEHPGWDLQHRRPHQRCGELRRESPGQPDWARLCLRSPRGRRREFGDERIKPGLRLWVNPVNSAEVTSTRSAVEVADSAGGSAQYVMVEDATTSTACRLSSASARRSELRKPPCAVAVFIFLPGPPSNRQRARTHSTTLPRVRQPTHNQRNSGLPRCAYVADQDHLVTGRRARSDTTSTALSSRAPTPTRGTAPPSLVSRPVGKNRTSLHPNW